MPSRLKSLELHGYKTFANRTLFEFADTITAIVGPNGSGKSNVADSLRWVLGEQSYSLLRARKTDDMIFSGSESRPRAGMATATAVFDNSDGWLPIDFSEVAIARRAYRDGQNEYLINGQRVRLKDVMELLSESGLAERTYTVIGQGLVDAALSLKADERRRLFEEAAGIGLHRSRREDAMRRLETTRRNLERVQDIMAELRPRLRSLERQARRASEYDQVKTDLQVLLREWYGYHWHHAQRELAEAQGAVRQQNKSLEKANKEQSEVDKELGEVRRKSHQIRQDLAGWHRQLAKLHTQREEINRRLAVAGERQRSLDDQEAASRVELANRQEESNLYQAQSEAARQDVERQKLDLEEAMNQEIAAKDTLEERLAERIAVDNAVLQARQTLAASNARQGRIQALISERLSQIEKREEGLAQIEQAIEAADVAHDEAQSHYRDAQVSEEKKQAASQQLEMALETSRKQLQSLDAAHREALEEGSELAARQKRMQAELAVLDQAEESLTGYTSGTRTLLEAAKRELLDGAHGALSHHLDVPSGLEVAIAAALGDFLDAVLLDGDPEPAMVMLQEKGERSVLLPSKKILPQNLLPTDAVERIFGPEGGLVGAAAKLISVPGDLQNILDLLLKDVYIVKDRQAAQRVLDGCPTGVRLVTLRGEIFHSDGPIQVAAREGTADDGSLLGRMRRRRELGANLEDAANQRDVFSERISALNEDLEAARAEVLRLEAAYQKSTQEHARANMELNQARLALQSAEQRVDWQAQQYKQLQTEIERARAEVETMSVELAQLDDELSQSRQRLREKSEALAELSLDEFQSQVAHWNTLAAVSKQALESARARLDEREMALERSRNALIALETRLDEIEAARIVNIADRVEGRENEVSLSEEVSALQTLIVPAEEDLAAIEGEQDRFQAEEMKSRQRLSQSEHYNAQTRIELARRQEALQTWRRRIEDDLGLVAFEYEEQVSGPTPLPLGNLVEQLPVVREISDDLEQIIRRQRAQLTRMGSINPEAQKEYTEVKERFEFLTEQISDLNKAEAHVRQVIGELDNLMQQEFRKTFEAVAAEFRQIFMRLFDGGSARLVLTHPDDLLITGIDIEARLPGRRAQGLALLSGGERSLTATALVFALLKVSPTPFCILDEVDAMLDETNVGRFREMLHELSKNTQFVIVTHNRNTVQAADVIYGVTMGRDSVSQILSLKLDEVSQVVK